MTFKDEIIYTFIFGGYDDLKEPEIITPGWKYVCFTDDPSLCSENWDIILVKPPENLSLSLLSREVLINGFSCFEPDSLVISIGGQIQPACDP